MPKPVPTTPSLVGSLDGGAGAATTAVVGLDFMSSGLTKPLPSGDAAATLSAAAAASLSGGGGVGGASRSSSNSAGAARPPSLSGISSSSIINASAPRLPGKTLPRPAPAPPPGFVAELGSPSRLVGAGAGAGAGAGGMPSALYSSASALPLSAAAALVPSGPNPYLAALGLPSMDAGAGASAAGVNGAKKVAPLKRFCKYVDRDGVGCTTFSRVQGMCAKHFKLMNSGGTSGKKVAAALNADHSMYPSSWVLTEPRRTYAAGGSLVWLRARKTKWRMVRHYPTGN